MTPTRAMAGPPAGGGAEDLLRSGIDRIKQGDVGGVDDLIEAYFIIERDADPKDPALVQLRNTVAKFLQQAGETELAAEWRAGRPKAREAKPKSDGVPAGINPEQVLQTLMQAMALIEAGKAKEAVDKFQEIEPDVDKMAESGAPQLLQMQMLMKRSIASGLMATQRYDEAQTRFESLAAMIEKQQGPKSPALLDVYNNLRFIARVRGDDDVLLRYSKKMGMLAAANPGSPEAVRAFLDEAAGAMLRNDYDDAEKATGLAIQGASQLGDPSLTMRAFVMAIEVSDHFGKHEDAETLLVQTEKLLGKAPAGKLKTYWSARLALVRAEHLTKTGKFAEAAKSYDDQLSGQIAGGLDPAIRGGAYTSAASAHLMAGNLDRAAALTTPAVNEFDRLIRTALGGGTDEEKRRQLGLILSSSQLLNTLVLEQAKATGPEVDLALRSSLRRKGVVLDSLTDVRRALRANATEEDRELLDQLAEIRALMATHVLGNATAGTPTLDELEAAEKGVIAKINARGGTLAADVASEAIDTDDLRAALPDDGAYVDYLTYVPLSEAHFTRDLSKSKPPRYMALVLPKEGPVTYVDLGEQIPLDREIGGVRKAMADKGREDVKFLAGELYAKVLAPVDKALGGAKHVIVSPDGALNLVPFGALVDGDGKFAVETRRFTYVGSGREVPRLMADDRGTGESSAILVGNPRFGAQKPRAAGARSTDLSDIFFPDLPGTAEEVDALVEILRKVDEGVSAETGAAANEETLKQVSSPTVLHVATHGFFLESDVEGGLGNRGLVFNPGTSEMAPAAALPENPLLRSGLALAGANGAGSEGEDGILTALEASNLDLADTQLVVLSACETGVGEVNQGEGVYGLRRAFAVAGARSQIISMWKVDDFATKDLMIAFYEQLRKGTGRGEALAAVQRKMLADASTAHPHYWAAFIASGDWRPLDLEPARPPAAGTDAQRDDPGRGAGRRGRGTVRSYWKEGFDKPLMYLYGGYSSPFFTPRYEGAAVDATYGVGVHMNIWVSPRLGIRLGYDYEGYELSQQPTVSQPFTLTENRIEVAFLVDVLALPAYWRVRPSLSAILGPGFGWVRTEESEVDPMSGAIVGSGTRDFQLAGGLVYGGELGLHIRLTDRADIMLRGATTSNVYAARDTPVGEIGEFPRAFRWEAGAALGFFLK